MSYKIWNKKDDINNIDCETVIKELNIKEQDEVFLTLTKTGRVEGVHIKDRIIDGYDLDINLSVQEVAQKYLEIIEQQKQDQEKERLSLEEVNKKISILEDGLKAVLRGDMQSLAYLLYPQDFENIEAI